MKITSPAAAAAILHDLGIPRHRIGYTLLLQALPLYAQENNLYVTKELYPQLAQQLTIPDWRAVEHAIREAIQWAWQHRDPEIWERFFPGAQKAPSNKFFLAVIAEYR